MAKVSLQHIRKSFDGEKSAVDDVSLEINDGEFVVFVGPSGCGKSTLLRMIAGLESPSSGEIQIDDRPVTQLTPQQRNIAMVFQNYALYPHMTVRENIAFPLRMAGLPKADIARRVEEIAHLLALTDLLERRPKALSGGQRQRVAMGRALVRQPNVFLLDEPLSNLDAKLRTQIRSEIAALQRRVGITTIYVTHDQTEAMTLGDRVVVLKDGRVQQFATPTELYRAPANIFVATFLGNPGMNILPTSVAAGEGDKISVKVGEQTLELTGDKLRAFDPTAQYRHLGIRPEALALDATKGKLKATVEDVEYLGHETLIHLLPDGLVSEQPLIARSTAGASAPERGQTLWVDFKEEDVYLFAD